MKTFKTLSFLILVAVLFGGGRLKAQVYGQPICGYGSDNTVVEYLTDGEGDTGDCNDYCDLCYGTTAISSGYLSYYYNTVYQAWVYDMLCYCGGGSGSCVGVGSDCTYNEDCCTLWCNQNNNKCW